MSRISSEKSSENAAESFFKSSSPAIHDLLKDIRRICDTETRSSILILGETGTGKEQLAKEIARLMRKKLVAVNMATLSKERAESELFGHRRGAFTGAVRDEPGLLRQAHQELFFMDEIGECSLEVQAKLLRVLQEKEVLPVGGIVPSKIDLQFIAATHQSLEAMIEAGRFRLDLFQRISTFVFQIPPLRERPEDIKQLLFVFLNECSSVHTFQVTPEAMEAIVRYRWPGNVRELKSFAERCTVFCSSRTIDLATVKTCLGLSSETLAEEIGTVQGVRDLAERSKVIAVMESVQGIRSRAAKKLGVTERTIYRLIKKHQLHHWDAAARSQNSEEKGAV